MSNLIGEFIGTIVLITFGCGVNANISLNKTYGSGGGWICTTAVPLQVVLLPFY